MPLTLEYKSDSRLPVDLAGLAPDWTCDRRLGEIERFVVHCGNQELPLAELFSVSGDPADGEINLVGDLAGVHRIGAGMSAGTIRVEGNVGRHAGAEMRGGQIHIAGDAGDWLGCQMRRGRIRVSGRPGNFAGGAYPGSPRGMTGGELFIDGAAGDEVGRSMRRGLIAIGGEAGDSLGLNLIAGTILVFGGCGRWPGAGLRRGTIGLFGGTPELLPTFVRAVRSRPQFVSLLLAHLGRAGFAAAQQFGECEYDLYHGDLLDLGKGEILVRA